MAEVQQHRLHIGGLAATVTEKDLVNRFSSFGKVVEGSVQGLGLDANGAPKTFAFLTLEATEPSLKKCLSLLSGSVWKGVKLRIAPAKPDYRARIASEQSQPTTQATKKRKRNPDPSVGRPSPYFELVDTTNFARHRGWALDTTASQPSPIFPLIVRPSHPLPPIPKAATTSWTREAPKAKASKEARALARAGLSGMQPVLSRAHRVRIDVRRWGRKKVVFDAEEEVGGYGKLRGVWEVEDDEEEGGEKDEVKWVFKTKDGVVRRSEVVRLGMRNVEHTDRFTALLEGLNRPPTTTEIVAASSLDDPIATDTTTKRQKSLSPPPYIPSAPRTLLFNEEDTFALVTSTQEASEAEEARQLERQKQLEVLKGLLGAVDEERTERGPIVEGFGEDSDDEEDFMGLLRGEKGVAMNVRGGAAPMEGDDESDSEDDSEDTEVQEDKDKGMGVSRDQLSSLKDMFKPQETKSSFSLLSSMDLDLNPLDFSRSPSPPLQSYPIATAPIAAQPRVHQQQQRGFAPPPALGRAKRAWIGTGAVTPFFPFPDEEELSKMGLEMSEDVVDERRKESAVGMKVADGFHRTQTLEEIEEEHSKLRENLRGLARKRHREAGKRGGKKKALAFAGTGGGGAGGRGGKRSAGAIE